MFVPRSAFHWSVDLPAFQRIKGHFPRPKLAFPPAAAQQALDAASGAELFGDGRRVAITVGSRGIAGLPAILVARIRAYGSHTWWLPYAVTVALQRKVSLPCWPI